MKKEDKYFIGVDFASTNDEGCMTTFKKRSDGVLEIVKIRTSSEVLRGLYNAIRNDTSIRRYSLGWSDIVDIIGRRYHTIEKTDVQFSDKLLLEAISITSGGLKNRLEIFAKELSINLETIRDFNRPRFRNRKS
jgi:hypothetical protein